MHLVSPFLRCRPRSVTHAVASFAATTAETTVMQANWSCRAVVRTTPSTITPRTSTGLTKTLFSRSASCALSTCRICRYAAERPEWLCNLSRLRTGRIFMAPGERRVERCVYMLRIVLQFRSDACWLECNHLHWPSRLWRWRATADNLIRKSIIKVVCFIKQHID